MANTSIALKHGDQLTVTVLPDGPPPVFNKFPLAAAGSDKTIKLPLNETQLTGVGSDIDGTIVKYLWEKKIGPSGGSIIEPSKASTRIVNLLVGDYTYKFTVTDDKGATAADDIQIFVRAADPVPPIPGKVDYLNLPAFSGTVVDDMVISNVTIGNPNGVGMNLVGKRNIKFVNCYFKFTKEEAISFENSNGLRTENCLFSGNQSAVYGLNSSNMTMINCQAVNMRQRPGGSRGQLFQANSCDIILVENCRSEGFDGESSYEDHISFYRSHNATARGNWLRGGGPSDSGSGIMTGDNGGSNQLVENNHLMRTGNAGIGVAGGTNIKILNNQMYSERTEVSNNPLYVWAQSDQGGNGVIVKGNRAYWEHKNGGVNQGWNSGNIPNTSWEAPTTITFEQMNFPEHLITLVTPAELLIVRKQ